MLSKWLKENSHIPSISIRFKDIANAAQVSDLQGL